MSKLKISMLIATSTQVTLVHVQVHLSCASVYLDMDSGYLSGVSGVLGLDSGYLSGVGQVKIPQL